MSDRSTVDASPNWMYSMVSENYHHHQRLDLSSSSRECRWTKCDRSGWVSVWNCWNCDVLWDTIRWGCSQVLHRYEIHTCSNCLNCIDFALWSSPIHRNRTHQTWAHLARQTNSVHPLLGIRGKWTRSDRIHLTHGEFPRNLHFHPIWLLICGSDHISVEHLCDYPDTAAAHGNADWTFPIWGSWRMLHHPLLTYRQPLYGTFRWAMHPFRRCGNTFGRCKMLLPSKW